MIFLDRRSREADPSLDWKIRVFAVGAILALVGMALESRILVWLAVAALLLGITLRFWAPGGTREETSDGGGGEGGPDEETLS